MKKILLGIVAGSALAYLAYRLAEEGKFDGLCDDANRIMGRTKKKIKDGIDMSVNQAEYLKDRAKYKTDYIKEAIEKARSNK